MNKELEHYRNKYNYNKKRTVKERIKDRLRKENLDPELGWSIYTNLWKEIRIEMSKIKQRGDMLKYKYKIIVRHLGTFFSKEYDNTQDKTAVKRGYNDIKIE